MEKNEEKKDENVLDSAISGGIIECDMDKVLHNSMIAAAITTWGVKRVWRRCRGPRDNGQSLTADCPSTR